MNDTRLSVVPSSATVQRASEEPRAWWNTPWQMVKNLWHPRSDAEVLRDVVEELIEEPASESGISPAEGMLLANIMNLREKRASDCMVPRADIVAADLEITPKALVELMASSAHSRIPLYRETLDDVIGMVHMKDLVPLLSNQDKAKVADLLRPLMFVAPSMPASKLLLQMRQTRQHMALVVDEFGGIDGLVTIEDLVEEIVGEIEDEHDAPSTASIIARPDGTLLVDARLPIKDFEARTNTLLDLPEEGEVDTLGGYVANLAGRIPHIGENFHNNSGMNFEILEMDQSRIKRLRVRSIKRHEAKPSDQARAEVG